MERTIFRNLKKTLNRFKNKSLKKEQYAAVHSRRQDHVHGTFVRKSGRVRKNQSELIKLKTLDKTAGAVSTLISRGAAVLIFSMFTIIVNVGIALWLGDILGKTYYGFFCVAAFYGI